MLPKTRHLPPIYWPTAALLLVVIIVVLFLALILLVLLSAPYQLVAVAVFASDRAQGAAPKLRGAPTARSQAAAADRDHEPHHNGNPEHHLSG